MNIQDLIAFLESEGYTNIKFIEGVGLCGLKRFVFTTGLVVGLEEYGFVGRYCYANKTEALSDLEEWDGKDDPNGDWIKYKGRTEYSNPRRGI